MKPDQEYYLGLDIGTNSLGWAVTDPEYNILEYRRKAMWGIHLFDEGNTAAERRMHRCARRRLNRRKQRIVLLRELFSKELFSVDPSFYDRLDSSSLVLEDREDKQKNSLFNDPDFSDVDYHSRFPTIYHLRKYLMETSDKPDLRLIYLACHHIVKYRGHFLFGESESSILPDFSEVIGNLVENLCQYDDSISIANPNEMASILSDRSMTVTDKKRDLSSLISNDTEKSDLAKGMCTLLAGGKIKLSKLFDDDSLEELSICFKDATAEEQMSELEDSLFGSDYYVTLELSKKVYDWSVLSGLLTGHLSISEAKVAQYEQHMEDLAILKRTIRQYAPSKYRDFFKSAGIKGNYCSYVGVCGKGKPDKTCDQIEFCKYTLSILNGTEAKNDVDLKAVFERLSSGTFMPKQTSKENSVLPYSVHRMELRSILENASKHYPFLKITGDDGFTIADKVLMIQCFRIPYYVGPLGKGSKNSWAVRRSMDRITPWNFNEVVDLGVSAERFMENLTSFCTYMVGEKVLPKNSILYSYFQLYNELNNLRVNGDKIPIDVKRRMVRELFGNKGKVTKKKIQNYLKSINLVDNTETIVITGIDESVKANLNSEIALRAIIGEKVDNRKLAEDIIRVITVFGDERRIRFRLQNDYPDTLSEQEIRALSKLRFEGWGRLSAKLLTGLYDTCGGQDMNIMGILESTNDNFMEIYHKYSFKEQVERYNRGMTTDDEVTYESLGSMYISPAVRRGVWRTVSVVRDVVECAGHSPKKVFVETTRDVNGTNEPRRTDSRKDKLMYLYRACKEDERWISGLDGRTESELKSRSMYLYYTQLGRCMYCGRPIEFEELGNTDSVDRDHIFPQSKIKDDSIHNNMVLACKSCNGKKGNNYPVAPEVQMRMRSFWDELFRKGYITAEKHSRLIRSEEFSEDELDRFISRQLVETSQSAKAVIEIMKRLFGDDVDIVYVKSGLVSDFRQKYGFIKCRSVNDYHHAKDAYLNIIVGNVYDTKFTKNPLNFLKTNEKYNLGNMYAKEVSRNGTSAWIPDETGTIATVRRYMRRDNILFTKHQYIASGALFDDNPLRAKDSLFDRKSDLPSSRYGGFDNPKGACYSLVEYTQKNKKIRSLEVLHIHNIRLLGDIPSLNRYYSERLGVDVDIVIPVIRMNSLFEWGGFKMHIGGRTGNNVVFYPAVQLLLPDDLHAYCKKLYNYERDRKERVAKTSEFYGLTSESNIEFYRHLISKTGEGIHSILMGPLNGNMRSSFDSFIKADCLVQADILNEILKALHCNPETASFKKINGVGLTGRIVLNKKLPSKGEVFIINQSASGLNENRRRIN